jgi:hypothetical protein
MSRLLTETTNLVAALRAALVEAQANQDDRGVNAALGGLVRFEIIPRMEADLAAEHAKPNPDRAAIAALTEEIQSLHSRYLPDHIREQLLRSVQPEPVVEPAAEPQA